MRICCQANVSENRGLLKKENGETYNAGHDDLDESRNSELMNSARLDMLEGRWPSACSRCQSEEASGLRSRRIYENQAWGTRYSQEWASANTAEDGRIDTNAVPPVYFDIRLGNKCNLKCRMCGPTDSNLWYEDYHNTVAPSFSDTQGKVQISQSGNRWVVSDNSYDWHENEIFWDHLKKHAQWIEHLHIVGGEPLLIENHYKALEFLHENGFAKNITMEYNTNLMVLPQRALELWKHFKKVKVGVSLDGHGAVNDYIRSPSKWNIIVRNLERLNAASPNIDMWLSATIQVYNIYNITDLIRWKLESGLSRFNNTSRLPFITSHVLHHPKHYNIRILPQAVKAKVRQKFADFEMWFQDWALENIPEEKRRKDMTESLHKLLKSYADYMNKEDWSHLMEEFWNNTLKLDKARNQDFFKVAPELANDLFPQTQQATTPL